MLPDRVSNPGPLTYESGALPIALRGPARRCVAHKSCVPMPKVKVTIRSEVKLCLKLCCS